MHNNLVLPVSVEEFAAYLDGNLSQENMDKVESIIATNDSMHDIALNSQTIDDTMTNIEPLELMIPDDMSSSDFEIPNIEDHFVENDYFDYPEVAACEADPFGDDDIERDAPNADSLNHQETCGFEHPEFSENITETNDDILINQDGVDFDDTPDYNDL